MAELKVKKHTTYTYETSDGREFDDEHEAMEWQGHLSQFENVRALNYYFEPTDDVDSAIYVHAETIEQAEAFNAMQTDLGICANIQGTGYWRYDDISDSFIDVEEEIRNRQHIIDMLNGGGEG